MNLFQRLLKAVNPNNASIGGVVSNKEISENQYYGTVWACVQILARYTSAVDYYFEKNGKEVDYWFKTPNRELNQSLSDLIYQSVQALFLTGNCYIWESDYKLLWLVPTNNVEVNKAIDKKTGESFKDSYTVTMNGIRTIVPLNKMIHIRLFDYAFRDEVYFQGRSGSYESLEKIASTDYQLTNYIDSYFKNDATPPMVYETEQNLSETHIGIVKNTFAKLFNQKPPSLFIATGGAKFKPIETSANSLQNSVISGSISDDVLQRITVAFGMNPNILLQNFANKATIETMMEHFQTYTIEPIINLIESAFNVHLKETGILLKHQPPTFTDTEKAFNQQLLLFNSGVITLEEFREYLGMVDYQDVNSVKKKASTSLQSSIKNTQNTKKNSTKI